VLVVIALALGAPAHADEVWLVGGGRVRGRVVERGPSHVVIEVGPGRITLPASRVVAVESGRTALDQWRERSAGLAPSDADAWLSLGLWASDQGLLTQAREAFEKVLAVQPGNPVANAALGRVRLGDRWVSEEESYLARGYVRRGSRWITREAHALELEERRAEAQERSRRAEADARVRAAEARARAAEARADAVGSAPAYPGPWSPSPIGLVLGGGYGLRPGQCPPPPAPPPPPAAPRQRPPAPTGSFR
jgi:hypothetical protein